MNVAPCYAVRVCVLALVAAGCAGATPAVAPDAAAIDAAIVDGAVAIDAEAPDAAMPAADWRDQILYLAMTDRFANGDSANDALGLPDCFDPADPQKFHGGDFAGLAGRLDYVRELGATALWITPVYRQAPRG